MEVLKNHVNPIKSLFVNRKNHLLTAAQKDSTLHIYDI